MIESNANTGNNITAAQSQEGKSVCFSANCDCQITYREIEKRRRTKMMTIMTWNGSRSRSCLPLLADVAASAAAVTGHDHLSCSAGRH